MIHRRINELVARDGQMEGLPFALMESLACGVPTLSARLSGIEETHDDPAATEARRRAGRGVVCREFDLQRSVAALTELFERVPTKAGEPTGPAAP